MPLAKTPEEIEQMFNKVCVHMEYGLTKQQAFKRAYVGYQYLKLMTPEQKEKIDELKKISCKRISNLKR